MKAAFAIVCLSGALVSACTDDGNPGGSAYAGMPGGTIAAKPQTMGVVTYDPSVLQVASSGDSIMGSSGDKGISARPSTIGGSAARSTK